MAGIGTSHVYPDIDCVPARRRRRHHQSRTTRVWNVLDDRCKEGLGFWVLVARREEVLGFWLRGGERLCWFWPYGVKKDLDVEERTHCIYKGALLSVLHVSSSRNNLFPQGKVVASGGWERWEPHGGGTAWRSAYSL